VNKDTIGHSQSMTNANVTEEDNMVENDSYEVDEE
jgi:hypothetical protein